MVEGGAIFKTSPNKVHFFKGACLVSGLYMVCVVSVARQLG